MFFKPACRSCLRIRWFMMAALPLIIGLFLQPQWMVNVARLLPSSLTIGIGICVGGTAVFLFRLWHYKRTELQSR